MELIKLKEEKRVKMVDSDMETLDLLATVHNLLLCIDSKNWERLPKKTKRVLDSHNRFVNKLNQGT